MNTNKKMEIIEKKASETTRALQDILNKLNFISDDLHELDAKQIRTLVDAREVLVALEENLYFNNKERKERF